MTVNRSHILYIQTNGPEKPEHVFSSFVLVALARAVDINATICFSGLGALLVKKGIAQTITNDEGKTLHEIMDRALSENVGFKVCEESTLLLQIDANDLIPQAEIVGPREVEEMSFKADATIWC